MKDTMKIAGPMPIFCSDLRPLVRSGNKTQTRRIVKPQPAEWITSDMIDLDLLANSAPWKVGEVRYLREPLMRHGTRDEAFYVEGKKHLVEVSNVPVPWRWKVNTLSSLFMPAKYARTFCEITAVRCERLQEIKTGGAEAEGFAGSTDCRDNLADFKETWNLLNAKRSYNWESNPWVWVLSWKLWL